MTKVILHIGARKAGSTAIQKYLSDNHDQLSNQGFYYIKSARAPKELGDAHYAHHLAAHVYRADKKNWWPDITKEISLNKNKHTHILSSEMFYSMDARSILKIREYLSPFDTRVVFIVRDPLAFLESEYKQRIKLRGEYRSFIEFAKKNIHLSRFNYYGELWKCMFGIDNVAIIRFEDHIRRDGGIVPQFCNLIGYQSYDLPSSRVNTSLDTNQAIVVRFINRLTLRIGMNDAKVVRQIRNSIKQRRRVGVRVQQILSPMAGDSLISDKEREIVAGLLEKDSAA